jgi:DNA-binding LacI/PurR family transcriptional regulator
MADVARLAGVSHQTVSRVINDSDPVRPETRTRVREAMRLLDYRPNALARALVTGRTRTLGVVSFDTTLFGPASTLFGIEQAAHDAGYGVSVVSMRSPTRASVLSAVDRLRGHAVDGILVIAPQSGAVHSILETPADIPVVSVEAGPDDGVPVVEVDQFAGAQLATRHLLELGHRTVWHIAGPADFLEAQERIDGWRVTLEEAGAPVPSVLTGDWFAQSGYELGRLLLLDPEVTAVFAANDPMALGLLRILHETGRRVPDDVSVVGFDDVPEASYYTPPLTTVKQDFMQVGRKSFALLLDEIERGHRSSTRIRVAPELVVRQSTAPHPDRDT